MKLVRGKVVGGNVVLEGEKLAEGAQVTVLVAEDEDAPLTDEDERELEAASAEVARGEYLTAGELFDLLRRQRA